MSLRLLIADDNPQVRALLRATLDGQGTFRVIGEAADGNQALELIKLRQPDVALLDVGMPGLDGLQVSAALTARPGNRTAVVLISSLANESTRRRAIEAGAATLTLKSAPLEQLSEAIERACK
jgi:two-component system response regulator DesR